MKPERASEGRGRLASALTHLGPGAAYVVLLFVKGTERSAGTPLHISDKVLHAAGFGAVVPFALLALGHVARPLRFVARVQASVVTASALGALLELWQLFLPYRSADVLDWAADTVGAVLVAAVVMALAPPSWKGVGGAGA